MICRTFAIALAAILICSCSTSRVLAPPELEVRTDYVPGQNLLLNQDAFLYKSSLKSDEIPTVHLLGSHGTSKELETFQREESANVQVIGVLKTGERLRVEKITQETYPNLGSSLHVYARINGGRFHGTLVEITYISRWKSPNGPVYLDQSILTVIK